MKKVLLSITLMLAVCLTSSVTAQDVTKESCSKKTEYTKTCTKSDEKKCCKSESKKCCKSENKKCCKRK